MVRIFVDHGCDSNILWLGKPDVRLLWLETATKLALDLNEIKHIFIGYKTGYDSRQGDSLSFLLRVHTLDLPLIKLLAPKISHYLEEKFFDIRKESTRKLNNLSMLRDEIDDACSFGVSGMTYT